jgi:hypothetical protein
MSKTKNPETPREWATYRAKLNCRIGRDVIEGKTVAPGGISRTEYAIYNLLHAVEHIADALNDKKG